MSENTQGIRVYMSDGRVIIRNRITLLANVEGVIKYDGSRYVRVWFDRDLLQWKEHETDWRIYNSIAEVREAMKQEREIEV